VSGVAPPAAVGAVTLVAKNGRLYGKPDFFPAVDLRHDQCKLYKNTRHRECHSSDAHELPDHSPHVGSLDGPLLPALNSRFVWENAKKRELWAGNRLAGIPISTLTQQSEVLGVSSQMGWTHRHTCDHCGTTSSRRCGHFGRQKWAFLWETRLFSSCTPAARPVWALQKYPPQGKPLI
jgi:hypothetical protein